MVAVLLANLPTVQEIDIAELGFLPWLVRHGDVHHMLKRALVMQTKVKPTSPSMGVLRSLRTLSIAAESGGGQMPDSDEEVTAGLDINDFIWYLILPSLTTFCGTHVNTMNSGIPEPPNDLQIWSPSHVEQESLQLRHLRLEQSSINPPSLKNFLGCFTSLETFYYDNGGSEVGDGDFDASVFSEALSASKGTLREITIHDWVLEDSVDVLQDLGSFVDFPVLKVLDVMVNMIDRRSLFFDEAYLTKVLPLSLEILRLRGSSWETTMIVVFICQTHTAAKGAAIPKPKEDRARTSGWRWTSGRCTAGSLHWR